MRRYRCAAAFVCLIACVQAHAVTSAQARAKAYAWMIQQQKGDGSWVDSAGNQLVPTAIAVQAMSISGVTYGYVTGAGATWLLNANPSSVDGMARRMMALTAVGANTGPQLKQLLDARSAGQTGTAAWGAYPKYAVGMPDTALGVEAAMAANALASSPFPLFTQMQITDGGWAYGTYSQATHSDLIPTAHALRVLSKYLIANPSAKTSTVDTNLGKAVNWLLARKKNDGGFAEDANTSGSNDATKAGQVIETTLVWTALNMAKLAGITAATASATTTAMTNAETFVIGKQGTDGSLGGDALQTASALRMWADSGLMTDTDHDGVPDTVEAVLNTNSTVADARSLPKGNGNPVPPALITTSVDTGADVADAPTLPEWGAILMGSVLMLSMLRGRGQRRRD